jgi:hypothetical protein
VTWTGRGLSWNSPHPNPEGDRRHRGSIPQPDPPSAEKAAKIASAAWAQDADWGTFVWLTFVTGARRGELVALAWEHLDLISGLLTIRRNLVRCNGTAILKDTKTHQMRVIKLDQDTITILGQHKARAEQRCADLGTTLDDDAFVFSYAPDHRRHCEPVAITHRYAKMAADLGIDTHLHALCHYNATSFPGGASTCAPSLAGSATRAVEQPHSRSTQPGSPVPTRRPPISSPLACPAHPRYSMPTTARFEPVTLTSGTRHTGCDGFIHALNCENVLCDGCDGLR